MNTFHLRVVAHDRTFFDGQAVSVTLPAYDGELQILANHENIVFAMVPGEVRIRNEKNELIIGICSRGFTEVFSGSEVEVLASTVESPEEIDVRRATEAKERAEEMLRQKQSQMEYYRSKNSLARAMARLKEANKYRH